MGEMLAILALICFSLNILVTNLASVKLKMASGFFIALIGNMVCGGILFSAQLVLRSEGFVWNSQGFIVFLLAGLFSTYIGRRLFFETIALMGPAKASSFQVSNPLFTVIIAWIFLNESLTLIGIISVVVVVFGLILISYVPTQSKKTKGIKRKKLSLLTIMKQLVVSSVGLALISGVSYAVGNVLRGIAIRDWDEPIMGAIIGSLLGIIIQLLTSKNARSVFSQFKEFDRIGIRLYMASGFLTMAAQTLVIASMLYIPVSIANLITLSTPAIVTPISYFLLKNQEGLTKRTVTGIVLVLFGISTIVIV